MINIEFENGEIKQIIEILEGSRNEILRKYNFHFKENSKKELEFRRKILQPLYDWAKFFKGL